MTAPGRPAIAGGNHVLLLTPFTAELAVDEPSLAALVEHVLGGGVDGIIPLGTTGEFFSLADAEKRRVIDVVLEVVAGRVPVCVGVASAGTGLAVELARYAQARGAAAVMVPPPYYYPTSAEGMRLHFETVARAVELPVMLYDGGGGIEIPVDVIAQVHAAARNVCLVKESVLASGKVARIRERTGGEVSVLCGDEVMLLPELAEGAAGMATAAGNVLPRVATEVCRLFADGARAEARARFLRYLAPWIVSTGIAKGEFVRCFKEAVAHLGVIRTPLTRPPVPALSPARRADVIAVVDWLRGEGVAGV